MLLKSLMSFNKFVCPIFSSSAFLFHTNNTPKERLKYQASIDMKFMRINWIIAFEITVIFLIGTFLKHIV